jgi:hypothetical protein
MMSFLVGQDPPKQVPGSLITFAFRKADDLPVQLDGPSFLFPVVL